MSSRDLKDLSFPYKPYSTQIQFASRLVEIIEHGSIGILESPTGTGKSLSIICGVLTWLRRHYQSVDFAEQQTANLDSQSDPSWVLEFEEKNKRVELERALKNLYDQKQHRLRRSQLKKDTVVHLAGAQKRKRKIETKNNRLVQQEDEDEWLISDTEMEDEFSMKDRLVELAPETNISTESISSEEDEVGELPRIYYCSRTHSQIAQFLKELKKTMEKLQWDANCPSPSVVIVSSRKHLCINEKVSVLSDGNLVNERCLELIQNKNSSGQSSCPYFHLDGQRRLRDVINAQVIDIEDLVKLGRKEESCPYYGMRRALKAAQFILLPYQSLLHKPTRESLGLRLHSNCVVIFDEGHHIIDALNDMYGAQTTRPELEGCLQALERYTSRYEKRLAPQNLFYLRQFHSLLKAMVKFTCHELSQTEDSSVVYQVEDFIFRLGVENLNVFKLNEFLDKSFLHRKLLGFLNQKSSDQHLENQPTNVSLQCIHSVFRFVHTLTQPYSCVRLALKVDKNQNLIFRLFLLHAGSYLDEIISSVRTVVFAGGTLEPVRDIRNRLLYNVSEQRITHYSFDHVIPENHILPLVVVKGPTGQSFDFRYQSRGSDELVDELGRLFINVCRIVKGGIVVFFSSYSYLEYVLKHLKSTGVWKTIEKYKPVFQEPQDSSDLNQLLTNYSKTIEKQRHAILFAVIGGKLSEGINFQDELGRCIIIVGLAFPNYLDAELQESIRYITNMFPSISPGEIMEDMCMKLINQTIGRTIRHASDYGAVLLVDQRYTRESIRSKLSSWIRKQLSVANEFGKVIPLLSCFFRSLSPS
eukprot:jgi/Galph1/3638/GphlegSOOS_G2297.1